MYPELSPEKLAELREALLNLPQRFAAVEAVIYAEKCATLPLLSIEEGFRRFAYLYEMAIAFGHGVQRHPALEERHMAETLAIRQRFVQAAGRKPSG